MPEGKTVKTLGLLALAGVEPYQAAQGEEYMNPKQLDHFRRILDAWRQHRSPDHERIRRGHLDQYRQDPEHVSQEGRGAGGGGCGSGGVGSGQGKDHLGGQPAIGH